MLSSVSIIGPNEVAGALKNLARLPLLEGAPDSVRNDLVLNATHIKLAKGAESIRAVRDDITENTNHTLAADDWTPTILFKGALTYQAHSKKFNYAALSFRMAAPYCTYNMPNAVPILDENYYVSCEPGSEFYVFESERFEHYLSKNPHACKALLLDKGRLTMAAMNIISVLASPDATLKTLRLLRLRATIELEKSGQSAVLGWSHQQIAGSLGLSRASVANLLGELKKLGIVETSYQRIDLDLDGINDLIAQRK